MKPTRLLAAACALALAAFLAPASAQTRSAEAILASTRAAPDLNLPREAASADAMGTPAMGLYKPEGNGPFPALVLQHQCGGLKNRRWSNDSVMDWARAAVKRGWVVMVIDSLGPRGVDTVCMGPKGGVTFTRGTRDALQAAQLLATLPYVDKTRIATAGYSWGAMNALLGSSKAWGEALADGGLRFRASVALYPGCFTLRPPVGAPYEVLNDDTDRPLLVLMGGQDTETPASDCLPKLEAAKAAGAPVRWHLYPQATHCWDCKNLDGHSKVDVRGNQVSYRYDPATTQDSQRRVFEFLEEVMEIKR